MEKVLPAIEVTARFPQSEISRIVLQCVDPSNNHKKYYVMTNLEDTKKFDFKYKEKDVNRYEWVAQWGRIGSKPQQKRYSYDDKFEDTIMKKRAKGYVPVFVEFWGEHLSEIEEYFRSLGDDAWELE